MKKYIEPISERILIDAKSLLAGESLPQGDDEIDPDDMLGKKNFWDDEEEVTDVNLWD